MIFIEKQCDEIMINKVQKIIILSTVSILVIFIILITVGTNLLLHLMYSDQYMLDTAMDTSIVKTFNEMYPENKIRYVRVLDQEPAIVFEMIKDHKMAFLAVGNFEGKNLTFMYHCSSFDSIVFQTDFTVTSQIILDNPCF